MILQRYILRELVVTFAVALVVMVAVCAVGLILQMVRTYDVDFRFLSQAVPVAAGYMAPWAVLVAAVITPTMVYGRMGADHEIDAMRTSGIHASRIVAPAVLYSVVVFVLAFMAHHEVTPRARYAQRGLGGEAGKLGLDNPPPGRQTLQMGKRAYLSYADARSGVLTRPFLTLMNEKAQPITEYSGAEGTIEIAGPSEVKVTLQQGSIREYDYSSGKRETRHEGKMGSTTTVSVPVEDPYAQPKGIRDMAGLELVSELNRIDGGDHRKALYTEFQLRNAKALGPVCLIFLAVPIGIFVRKGTRMAGLGIALPPILGYLVLLFLGESLANRNLVSPEVGAFGADLIVLAIAGALLTRVFRQ